MKIRVTGGLSPKVLIPMPVYRDMYYIVSQHKTEVAWYCLVDVLDAAKHHYRLREVLLPHQEVAGSTVEIQDRHVEAFAVELLESRPEEYDAWRCWGHSHCNFGISSSSDDDARLEAFQRLIPDEAFIAIRINYKHEVQVDMALPGGLIAEDVKVEYEEDPELAAKWDALMDERVRPLVSVVVKGKALSGASVSVASDSYFDDAYHFSSKLTPHRMTPQLIAEFNATAARYEMEMYPAASTWAEKQEWIDDVLEAREYERQAGYYDKVIDGKAALDETEAEIDLWEEMRFS